MRVLWLVGRIVKQLASGDSPENAILACRLASARLRVAVAALDWKQSGNENAFCDPQASSGDQNISWDSTGICVVSKFGTDALLAPWLGACSAAKDNQCRLVVDICDYPFRKNPVVQTFYSEVLKMCDAVVVNSERMAEMVVPHTRHRPVLIDDAILGAMKSPEFAPGKRLELLWFGHPSNLAYLDARLEGLARFAQQRRCRLTVVTKGGAGRETWTQEIAARYGFAFEAQFIPWSLEAKRIALRKCDLALIPSDPSDPFKAGASANRIAEALNAGRFPVASPLPSYLPFAEAAWLGQDLVEGIKWALANRGEVLARIRRGQARVADKFAAAKIGGQWRELFENLVSSQIP